MVHYSKILKVVDKMVSLAKYIQISDIIRHQIHSGVYKEGVQLAPIKKLAEQYGTTKTTISKALAVLQREKLISCRQGNGTFVSSPQHVSIAIVSDFIIFEEGVSAYYLQILREVYAHCSRNGWSYQLYLNVDNAETAHEFLNDADNGAFNYVIVISRWVAANCVDLFAKKNIKLIGVYDYPELNYFSAADYIRAIEESIERLAAQGYKRIGIIRGTGKRDYEQKKSFPEKIIDKFRKNKLLYDSKLYIECPLTMENGYQAFCKLWKNKPEAIIITDALLTLGAARGVYEHQVDVKDELCIVSHSTENNSLAFPVPTINYSFSVKEQIDIIFDMINCFESGNEPEKCRYNCPPVFNNPFSGKKLK
jgi:DNA-binding LacI/PurR family transcriptional regulator